jgi:hypothetical protein
LTQLREFRVSCDIGRAELIALSRLPQLVTLGCGTLKVTRAEPRITFKTLRTLYLMDWGVEPAAAAVIDAPHIQVTPSGAKVVYELILASGDHPAGGVQFWLMGGVVWRRSKGRCPSLHLAVSFPGPATTAAHSLIWSTFLLLLPSLPGRRLTSGGLPTCRPLWHTTVP